MDNHIETELKQIPNRGDHKCFGCGPGNPIGLQMKFFTDEESVFSLAECARSSNWLGQPCTWWRIINHPG